MLRRLTTGLTGRMIGVSLIASIAVTILLLYVVSTRLEQVVQEAAEIKLNTAANQAALEVEKRITQRISEMRVLASVAAQSTPESLPALEEQFTELQRNMTAYSWMGLASPDGTVVASLNGLLKGASVIKRPWFAKGLQEKVVLSDIHEAVLLSSKLPQRVDKEAWRFIDVAIRVQRADGTILGVIGAHLSTDWLNNVYREMLADTQMLEGSTIYLIGPDGKTRGGPTPQEVAAHVATQGASSKNLSVEIRDTSQLLAVRTVGERSVVGTLGWKVAVLQPKAIGLKAVYNARMFILLAGAVAVLTMASLLIISATAILKPLRRLTDLAKTLSDPKNIIPPPSKDSGLTDIQRLETALIELARDRERLMQQTIIDMEQSFAKTAAEQSNLAKSRFLAAMSHELRTPLNVIVGFAKVLEDSDVSQFDQMKQNAANIRELGETLRNILNDILDYSKIEAGKLQVSPQPFLISQELQSLERMFTLEAQRKGIHLNILIPDLPWMLGDALRIRQICTNLLSNAFKFTSHGSVTLRATGTVGPGAVKLRCEVVDTGMGIPEAKQHELFEQFSQVHGDKQRTMGGTGLGLAICKSLIELMKGRIGVQSIDGLGSTFWFELELPIVQAPQAQVHEALAPLATPTGPRKSLNILVVDDFPLNRKLIKQLGEKANHRVTEAEGGLQAIALCEKNDYDLILMDIDMPGIDGYETAKLVRQTNTPVTASAPIWAMTGNAFQEDIEKATSAGMSMHFAKPLDIDALKLAILKLQESKPQY